MRLLLFLLLILLSIVSPTFADPFLLSEELSDTITIFYNDKDASDGQYIYSYAYPVVADKDDLCALSVNEYYRKKIQEDVTFYIPSQADDYSNRAQSVSIEISYRITCNNDDFFSVLIHKTEKVEEDETNEIWEGNTFCRSGDIIGSVSSLPQILGKVEAGENDEWLENRQSEKVWKAMCSLIWNKIMENTDNIDYFSDLQKEDLGYIIDEIFSMDHDFYINDKGFLVFFILPGRVAPVESGLLTYSFSLDEIRDEL